jgi:dCTP deaminase
MYYKIQINNYMTILGDKNLRKALENEDIVIDPKPKEIEPASIDLRVGKEAFLSTAEEVTHLDQGKLLILPAGGFALIISKEKLKLSSKIVGHIGLRSEYTRKGLVLLAGPQIDPGFEGNIHIAICNLSPTEISLAYDEPFFTIEFHELPEPVEHPYTGGYQYQDKITLKEIKDIRERRGYALSDVIKNMQSIASDISGLRAAVTEFSKSEANLSRQVNKYLAIFVATIVTLTIGILGILFKLVFK